MNILEKIIAHKKQEVAQRKKEKSLDELFTSPLFNIPCLSFKEGILNGSGIIAEFKRKSPSGGVFSDVSDLSEVIEKYDNADVSGCSILTDETYFGGSIDDLFTARKLTEKPLLRKDFIVDEYQIFEAKAYGADAILLISEALDDYHAQSLATIARTIGLEVLMEFHSIEALDKLNENVDVIGVNNRNLKTLKTDIRTSFDLISRLPYGVPKISESGISSPYEMEELIKVGYDGFLIGESVLRSEILLPSLVTVANASKTAKVRSHA